MFSVKGSTELAGGKRGEEWDPLETPESEISEGNEEIKMDMEEFIDPRSILQLAFKEEGEETIPGSF